MRTPYRMTLLACSAGLHLHWPAPRTGHRHGRGWCVSRCRHPLSSRARQRTRSRGEHRRLPDARFRARAARRRVVGHCRPVSYHAVDSFATPVTAFSDRSFWRIAMGMKTYTASTISELVSRRFSVSTAVSGCSLAGGTTARKRVPSRETSQSDQPLMAFTSSHLKALFTAKRRRGAPTVNVGAVRTGMEQVVRASEQLAPSRLHRGTIHQPPIASLGGGHRERRDVHLIASDSSDARDDSIRRRTLVSSAGVSIRGDGGDPFNGSVRCQFARRPLSERGSCRRATSSASVTQPTFNHFTSAPVTRFLRMMRHPPENMIESADSQRPRVSLSRSDVSCCPIRSIRTSGSETELGSSTIEQHACSIRRDASAAVGHADQLTTPLVARAIEPDHPAALGE